MLSFMHWRFNHDADGENNGQFLQTFVCHFTTSQTEILYLYGTVAWLAESQYSFDAGNGEGLLKHCQWHSGPKALILYQLLQANQRV